MDILDSRVRISYKEHQKCDGKLVENEKLGLLSPETDRLLRINDILQYNGGLLR